MIVCPASLITKWRNEIWKWLGKERVGIFLAEDTNKVEQFNKSRDHEVLIIDYETLPSVIDTLASSNPKIDLIICDEGHRLNPTNNYMTSKMFEVLKTSKRIVLSDKLIQHELSEFWSMADFCNPGVLGDYNDFNLSYEQPILRSRTPNCSPNDKEIGVARSDQLSTTSRSFVLRRTVEITTLFSPAKGA